MSECDRITTDELLLIAGRRTLREGEKVRRRHEADLADELLELRELLSAIAKADDDSAERSIWGIPQVRERIDAVLE